MLGNNNSKKEKEKKEEQFKKIEVGEKPFDGAFIGDERQFGLPNKVFKVYLDGEGNDGLIEPVPTQLITPKARKLNAIIGKVGTLSSVTSGEFFDLDEEDLDGLLDLIQELFQIPDVEIDRLTFESLYRLVGFAITISINPRNTPKK